MKHFALTLTGALMLSTSSLAQEAPKQTVEGAHRFIEIVVTQHGMDVEHYTPDVKEGGADGPFNLGRFQGGDRRNPNHGTEDYPAMEAAYWMDPFPANKVSGTGCQSTFGWPHSWVRAKKSYWGQLNSNLDDHSSSVYWPKYYPDIEKEDLVVDWSKAAGITVEQREGKGRISVVGGGRFTVPTEALATRVQFAMEFLKNACDKTADTGF